MSKAKRKGQFIGTVANRSRFGQGHEAMTIAFTGEAAESFAASKAGQFINLACRNLDQTRDFAPLLRRPVSMAAKRVFPDRTEIDIIFRIIGPGTTRLSELEIGHTIDVLGPLGNGFTIPKDSSRKAILIGGGIGLPPMFFLADMLAEAGIDRIGIGAARTVTMIEDALSCPETGADILVPGKRLSHFVRSNTNSLIATDDGSCGFKGNAIELLKLFVNDNPDWKNADIFCCGPGIMLKFAAEYAKNNAVSCFVCMEAFMSCGIGLCQSCAVASKSSYVTAKGPHYKLVCVNGPVFNADEIVWE